MEAIFMCVLLVVIAIVGTIYFEIRERKEARKH
jgi:hypothetical protein